MYNIIFPFVFLLGLPSWLLKMKKRGGYGTGLKQRLGRYDTPTSEENKGGVYVHAVSVGEVMIALKLIREWKRTYPEEIFVIAATTSTGYMVAREHATEMLRVIYCPVDFSWMVRKVLNRFAPKVVVLIESEIWPNLLNQCRKKEIPVHLVNARLSPRSERRYRKLRWFTAPLFAMLKSVLVQYEEDQVRWKSVGLADDQLVTAGSVKFDSCDHEKPQRREEFQEILDKFHQGRKIVMFLSSFPGEEYALAKALENLREEWFLVVAPRHMERRLDVYSDLERAGFDPVLRSTLEDKAGEKVCLIIDSTGELKDWTAFADRAVIGKSWLTKGGQNPAEAVAAKIPVIVGPRMDNFEPLVSQLKEQRGILQLAQLENIADVLRTGEELEEMAENALVVLEQHQGATIRVVEHIVNT